MKDKTEYWLLFFKNQLLVQKVTQGYIIPAFKNLPEALKPVNYVHKLEESDTTLYNTGEIPTLLTLPKKYSWLPLKTALQYLDQHKFSLTARAYQLIQWDKHHRYCGNCGKATEKNPSLFAKHCSSCDLSFFPRISPSIIVLIQKKDQLLLARQAHFAKGVYGLIAGFVEPGESLEEAVHREVHEEVGIKITNLSYFASQSWPFPDSLMLAFTADYLEGDIQLLDGELAEAGWYSIHNLPGLPSSKVSIAQKMIDRFIQQNTR